MPTHPSTLAVELRDGVLQDLIATSLLIEAARRALGEDESSTAAAGLLATAASTLDDDIKEMRALIRRLQRRAAA